MVSDIGYSICLLAFALAVEVALWTTGVDPDQATDEHPNHLLNSHHVFGYLLWRVFRKSRAVDGAGSTVTMNGTTLDKEIWCVHAADFHNGR